MSEAPLKYLGTDHHTRKLVQGKFSSNVTPRRFGIGNEQPTPWDCNICEITNPSYMVNCRICCRSRRVAEFIDAVGIEVPNDHS